MGDAQHVRASGSLQTGPWMPKNQRGLMGQQHSSVGKTDFSSLVGDLKLNGTALQPPRIHPVDWNSRDVFTAEDDPDRTSWPFSLPSFLSKDPVEQRTRTRVEELSPP